MTAVLLLCITLQIQCLKIQFRNGRYNETKSGLMKQFANAAINQDGEKRAAANFSETSPGQQPQYEPPSMSGSRPMPDIPTQRQPMNMPKAPALNHFQEIFHNSHVRHQHIIG